ncbi:tryptophan--tRNA ligase, mitochondrial [Phlebotomus argentipes]|uniref:tryptophan--tRNA ligase, mitochondrial n=1 Tax=Phlebotomus argentipes TaxID=94469 RepID=UPI0028933FBB|nr:tryptophan--tRNA ligase, mitochondrial [Phlebotomus argentipes]
MIAIRVLQPVKCVKSLNSRLFCSAKKPTWPRKIFSGIQPTGGLHIGNYLGAISQWVNLQNAGEDVTYCIVDLHSITLPQDPAGLRENILGVTASLLACGIDPKKSTLFLQSDVKQHAELGWILGCHTTMARLGHLPQFKEKSAKVKEIPLGLFVYPVLQAADILLYKATHVPVGEDQVQHLQLAQHLAKTFNTKFGATFPHCHALVADDLSNRIKSLREPTRKMSKSDADPKATILLTDSPDAVVEKVKKAVTDFTSAVTFDPENRPGVSNLITIHSLMSQWSPEEICEMNTDVDTGKYKARVAEAVVEHLTPIRLRIEDFRRHPDYLCQVLDEGAQVATELAEATIQTVKERLGLGKTTHSRQECKKIEEN